MLVRAPTALAEPWQGASVTRQAGCSQSDVLIHLAIA